MDIQRLTIITDDLLVIVDNYPVVFPSLDLPEGVHAVQWLSGDGEVEYRHPAMNEKFKDLSPFSHIIAEHQRLKELELTLLEPTEAEQYAVLISGRNAQLQATDWLVLRHLDEKYFQGETTLTKEKYRELLVYRDLLRELPQQYKSSLEWKWPELPECIDG